MDETIGKVCKHLPKGWEINLCMENGAAWVTIFSQNGEFEKHIDGADKAIEEQLNEAICFANKFE